MRPTETRGRREKSKMVPMKPRCSPRPADTGAQSRIARPGLRAFALLLAFVAGCSDGSFAAPDGGSDAPADVASPGSRQAEIFDPDTVQTFELGIAAADLERMKVALPLRITVPATFRWKDVYLAEVGVRYKGNSSSSPDQKHKRGFLVDFDATVAGQRLFDLRSLALDNGIQFGSLFSERLITEVLRQVGVPASRANYARVVLNGQYIGLYVNVERIGKPFLERAFADPEGNLYKCDEGGPGANLAWLGDDPAAYAKAFEAKTNEKTADLADLVALARMLEETPDAEIAEAIGRSFEIDRFLRMTAVLLLAGAFDQYTGFNAHNYYLYREPATGRWSYIPWDLDVGFADNAFGTIPVIDRWNAAWPLPVVPRPLLERILDDPGQLASYRRYAAEYLEAHFLPATLEVRLDALFAQAKPHLVDDPFPPVRVTNPGDRSYATIVDSLKAFIRRRYDRARSELADPKVTPPIKEGGGEPAPGSPTPYDPTDLRVVAASGSRVELAWTDNAPNDVGSIVQKCAGAACESFVNAIGQPGANITSAIDMGVTPGATYRYRVYAVRAGGVGTGPSNVVAATPAR
jgi:hypothetical protein